MAICFENVKIMNFFCDGIGLGLGDLKLVQ